MVFFILYVSSFLFVISSDDWFLIWLGLEFNMLSFIMLIYRQMSLSHIESCLKYFFVQSLGSAILMGGFYLIKYNFLYFGSVILSYKMGAGPFYFWFPSVCSGLSWGPCFFLMTIQKIIPLMLMVFFISWIIWILVIISLFMGAMGSFNQNEIKRLMAFSSIHHSGWLMMCIILESSLWIIYLCLYIFVILPIFLLMNYCEINDLNNLDKWKSKWWMVMCMLSMGGMPPFLGFFLKWIVFYFIMKTDLSLILLMIFMSIIMFYVYVRIVYDLLLGLGSELGWFYKKMDNNYILMMDFFSVFGMLIGGVFGFMLLF